MCTTTGQWRTPACQPHVAVVFRRNQSPHFEGRYWNGWSRKIESLTNFEAIVLLLRAAVCLSTAVGSAATSFVTTSVFNTLTLHRPLASHVGRLASSVSIVTGRSGVRVSVGAWYVYLFQTVQTGSGGPPQPQVHLAPGCLPRGARPRPGFETDHLLPPSAEVKNEWSYTSTSPTHTSARCVL